MRRRAFQATGILAGLVALWLCTVLLGGGIPCVFFALTGWYCPGCGATRAVMALSRFQLGEAFWYNPLFVVLLPVLLVILGHSAWLYILRDARPKPGKRDRALAVAIFLVATVYTLLRNLPAFSFLAPGTL